MGFIPQITCRHCGKTFSGIHNRCPHCGAPRVKQSGRTPASTTGVRPGTAASRRANSNTQMQFIFGCVLIALVIVAVIILISASLGSTKTKTIDITGTITWNDAAGGSRPASVTVNLLAGGQKVDEQVVSAGEDGSWTYSFTKKDKFDETGAEIRYTVGVNSISNYTSSAVGYNVTISYVEPVVETPSPEPTPTITSITVTFLGGTIEEFSMHIGDAPIDLDATAYPVESGATVKWRSSDESICTVDEDGKVSAVGPGWAEVIAECGAVAKSVKVLVIG
ncbi:MAG: Cna B-type domain-containing protein [Oscillospiraceae bacterium]